MKKLALVISAVLFAGIVTGQKPIHLDKASFKEKVYNYEKHEQWVYQGDKPAIVDFYADWCAPCKQIAPIMKDIASEYEGQLVVYKVDTEKQKELAAAFGIKSLPSILFIPQKGQPQMAKGALPRKTFDKAISDIFDIETN